MKHYIAIVAMSLFKIQKSSWKLITNNNDLSDSSLEKLIQSCSTNKCWQEFQEEATNQFCRMSAELP